MKILYLYMFPLWGNGSGAWLRRMISSMKTVYGANYEAAILAPEKRKFSDALIYHLEPPVMGVFVGNPELRGEKKYKDLSNKQHLDIFNYYLAKTNQAVSQFKPDLIHVFHTAFLPGVAKQVSDLHRIPYIITSHGSDVYYLKEDKRWFKSVYEASRQSKFITVNSNFSRDLYLELFGEDLAKKTRTIPAGIENNIDFGRDVSWIDKKYGFRDKKMVLFTGRLTQHKGVDYLIKAARQIKGEVVILGDGPERPYLEKLINEYKLTNVHMLGYFSQRLGKINDFYLRADVYVAPSTWDEPLGLVILEAMVHKTPVVVTRKGGVATIVKDGINGFLVRPRSGEMISRHVNLLLENDDLRRKMAESAYQSVKLKFSWEKISAKFFSLYKQSVKINPSSWEAVKHSFGIAFQRLSKLKKNRISVKEKPQLNFN